MSDKYLFISGWAGYPDFFPRLSSRTCFVLPFVTHTETGIKTLLKYSWDMVLGWSLGAHLCLKNLDVIQTRHLCLMAPFLDFTRHTPLSKVQDMLQGMQVNPEVTVRWFWRRGGIKYGPGIPREDLQGLEAGLRYLVQPKALELNENVTYPDTIIIHGTGDRIVSRAAAMEVHRALLGSNIFSVPEGHFIPEEIISELINEHTGAKIL